MVKLCIESFVVQKKALEKGDNRRRNTKKHQDETS